MGYGVTVENVTNQMKEVLDYESKKGLDGVMRSGDQRSVGWVKITPAWFSSFVLWNHVNQAKERVIAT